MLHELILAILLDNGFLFFVLVHLPNNFYTIHPESGLTSHNFDNPPNMAASSQQATMETYFENINHHLAHDWLFALLATVGVVLAYRIIQSSRRRSRLIASLNSEAHHYFSVPAQWYAVVKNHILYAPLLSWNLGKVPTRFQALFLVAVIGANAGLCCCVSHMEIQNLMSSESFGLARVQSQSQT